MADCMGIGGRDVVRSGSLFGSVFGVVLWNSWEGVAGVIKDLVHGTWIGELH